MFNPPIPPPSATVGVASPPPPPTTVASLTSFLPPKRPSPEDAIDYVTVSDPVIHADGGMNRYTSYRVDCRPPPSPHIRNDGGTGGAGDVQDVFLLNNPGMYSSVLRRYSDFLWLYERLHVERGGAIVPPLPEKQAVSRFSPEFVEDRRKCLERFLRRVVLHPELWDSACLSTFLRADDVAFQRAKNSGNHHALDGQHNPPSFGSSGDYGGGAGGDNNGAMGSSSSLGGAGAFNLAPKNAAGIKKWFSEARTTFSGDLVSSPDDDLFDEIERYVDALGVQMKRVSNQASALVRKSREIANGMFEFGLAFHQLGQSEGGDLGNKLQLMGGTADALSSMAASQAEAELRRLEEPLRDYIRIIQGVRLALARRHESRVSYTALLHEIQTREVNLHRLRMTPGSEAKAYSTEMSLQRYHAAANASREAYAECSQRVLREVDRFKREKAEEMKSVVLDFILLEIEVNRAMERVWGDLVPKLEGGGGDVGGIDDAVGGGSGSGVGAASGQQQHTQMPHTLTMNAPPISQHQPAHAGPSAPIYSNVPNTSPPPPSLMATNTTTAGTNPMMESSIQYREYDPRGMGF
ncbi:hypothetical protein ACHAXA_008394 [Cyclostephanos tholiformis]|uniref:PX domain-containing protein n=1 Tax=Cyclostephanos tholiformis TaxID=382380 RepID=A0ABD3RVT4_9STRA